ncbi:hypothetical protein SESBI_10645 [Sesbania bispinosa]|nr:hypothetical protein SESBI_10645 [Sesbania bispinosa]
MGEKKGFASAACERWRCGRTEGDNNDERECLTVVRGVSRTCWWWTMIGKGWTRIARVEEERPPNLLVAAGLQQLMKKTGGSTTASGWTGANRGGVYVLRRLIHMGEEKRTMVVA